MEKSPLKDIALGCDDLNLDLLSLSELKVHGEEVHAATPSASGVKSTRSSPDFVHSTNSEEQSHPASFTEAARSSAHQPSSLTSTMTRSNVIGTGRVLGRAISRGGRIVEASLGQLAYSLGFGPLATAQKIYTRLTQARVHLFSNTIGDRMVEEEVHVGCEKLLQFTKENVPLTQQASLKTIVALVCAFPVLRNFFVSPSAILAFDATKKIRVYRARNAEMDDHCKMISHLLRCVALCTEHNPITEIVDIYVKSCCPHSSPTRLSLSILSIIIPFFSHPVLCFPAMQYSKAIIIQGLLESTDSKEKVNLLSSFDCRQLNLRISKAMSSEGVISPQEAQEEAAQASSKDGQKHDDNWEKVCYAFTTLHKTDPQSYLDSPGLDSVIDMFITAITQTESSDWVTCEFSVDFIYFYHNPCYQTVLPKTHFRANSLMNTLIKGQHQRIHLLDDLTISISNLSRQHRDTILATSYEYSFVASNFELLRHKCAQLGQYTFSVFDTVKLQALDNLVFVITQHPFLRDLYFNRESWNSDSHLDVLQCFSDNAVTAYTEDVLHHLRTDQPGNTVVLFHLLHQGINSGLGYAAVRFAIFAIAQEAELGAASLPCKPDNCRCYSSFDQTTSFSWEDISIVLSELLKVWKPKLQAASWHWLSAIDRLCISVLDKLSRTCSYQNTVKKGAIPSDYLVELMTAIANLPMISVKEIEFPSYSRTMLEAMEKEIMGSEPTFEILTWAKLYDLPSSLSSQSRNL